MQLKIYRLITIKQSREIREEDRDRLNVQNTEVLLFGKERCMQTSG